ncbi:MAG: ThiF family adenylyltransferase [Candidimonas sp.]|nr:ThiF family adenylyltransferase [Candidimonas sp.]
MSPDEPKPKVPVDFYAGWHISVPDGAVRAPGVRYFVLVIGRTFPNSQPRMLVPELGSLFQWPHVEPAGLLCLAPTSIEASTRDRVGLLLDHTFRLLNFSDKQCQAEFRREFGSYWSQLATRGQDKLRVLSLLKPSDQSRKVIFHFAARQRRIIVADDFSTLSAWRHNVGEATTPHQTQPALLLRLQRPWLPDEFPATVAQSINGIPDELVRPVLLQHPWSLFVFEAPTDTGPVFAAVLINSNKLSKLKNGFRSLQQVPLENIKRGLASQRVERVAVSRLDPAWVHGRGHSADLKSLQVRRVAIIGCGSIGSEIAALLAKAGVGELALLDHDTLNSANLGRHFLGATYLGRNKAQALAQELCYRLPHLGIKSAHPKKFEWLSAGELSQLADMDLIVTAGLDFDGEAAVNAWRHTLDRPPAYVSTWAEAFCTAGHAVLLYGPDDLMARFEQERPTFRLTDWPQEANHLIIEAGCGNVFQPHGAADLLPIIAMAARLVLDAFAGRVPDSCRRTWFGDREAVTTLQGITRDTFTEINAMRQFRW